jgi:hypothetical protein
MRVEDSIDSAHRGTEVVRQYLGGHERKPYQVPANSIRKVQGQSPWLIREFPQKITFFEPINPSLRLQKWVNLSFKDEAEYCVSRFVSKACQEEKLEDSSLLYAADLMP